MMDSVNQDKTASIIYNKMIETYHKKKYFLNINLKSYKNLCSIEIINITPFFEIEVNLEL